MPSDGRIIKLPEYESNVFGLDLTVVVGVEETFQPGHGIAHEEYLFAEIISTGASQYYPTVKFGEVAFPFLERGKPMIYGVRGDILYAAMSADLVPTRITLEENLVEAAHFGANIVAWARNESTDEEEQIVEVLVAPLVRPIA